MCVHNKYNKYNNSLNMDLFYKPPLQRDDECGALEENYMNCLLQKAMRDNVLTNRCVLDSVLWFHLECPKAVAKFDDPIEFKRKFRDFLAEQRTAVENIRNHTEENRRIKQEFSHIKYPEDLKEHKELRQYKEVFKQYMPERELNEDFETEELTEFDQEIDLKEAEYGTRPSWAKVRPIRKDESLKHKAQ